MPSLTDSQPGEVLPLNDAARESSGRWEFTTTHWSVVVAAGESTSSAAASALEQLCASYYYPLYAYVRRCGHNPDDAKDLTQEFFARLLERKSFRLADRSRGRFRTFLLTSLKHFLVNEWKRANRQKRGAGVTIISWDEALAESRFSAEPAADCPAEARYDRAWAAMLMERTLLALRAEFEQAGKLEMFERLKSFVWGEQNALSYAAMAEHLAMSEGAVKVAVHRLRQRYGQLLRAEIAQTVSTAVEAEEELRYLVAVVRHGLGDPCNLAPGKL
jgi:RNA polymerase sigma-70 factor (ECF subfamily)